MHRVSYHSVKPRYCFFIFCEVLDAEYQKAVAALEEAGLPSLDSFVKEQGLKVSSLLL